MNINRKNCIQLRAFLNKIKKSKVDFTLEWDSFHGENLAYKFEFNTFKAIHLPEYLNFFKLNYSPLLSNDYSNNDEVLGNFYDDGFKSVYDNGYKTFAKNVSNVKYVTSLIFDDTPLAITRVPSEAIVNGTTYRLIMGPYKIQFIASHMDRVYDYLDINNLFNTYQYIEKGKSVNKYVIANVFTYEILIIFYLCSYSSKFPDMLEHGFFINPKNVAMYRLKMEKGLNQNQKELWKTKLAQLEEEYKSNTTLIFADKLAKGEVDQGDFNNITFTENTATYHTVTINYPKLFEKFMNVTSVINQFDIYDVVKTIAKIKSEELELVGTKEVIKKIKKIKNRRWHDPIEEMVDEKIRIIDPIQFKDGIISLDTFYINNIPLTLTKHEKSGYRKLNGIRINANEIADVIFRCSCFQDELNYTNFLKQTSTLNLKATDAVSSGLGVKIDENYLGVWSDPKPHPECTKLYFKIIDKKVRLIVSETEGVERTVPVKLNYLIKKIETINRLANGKYQKNENNRYSLITRKEDEWARRELIPVLKAATSFTTIVTEKDESGTEVEKESVKEHLTEKDLEILVNFLDVRHANAIEKSKEFLEMAIKATEAKLTIREGKEYYFLKGNLTEYYINKETCQVFDARSNGYICIVNSSHDTGVGYDDLAARLYALHNDSMLVDEIYTLKDFVGNKNKPVYLEVDNNADQEIESILEEENNDEQVVEHDISIEVNDKEEISTTDQKEEELVEA